MNKLYAVKLKNTPSQGVKGRYIDKGHHTGKSEQQVIDLIFQKGISRVKWIRHDDRNPVNQHRLDKELLQIWKGVAAKQGQKKTLPV
jgi:hypothetical protein